LKLLPRLTLEDGGCCMAFVLSFPWVRLPW